ncbi:MAG: hypothetical protein QJR08_09540 [Bacillota bacterium]|nr:hypothetical protein [Bacillota bacterium]
MPIRLIWLLIATLLGNVVTWADQIARAREAGWPERRLAQRIAESARAMREDAMAQAQAADEVAASEEPYRYEEDEEADPGEEATAPVTVPQRNPWRTVAFVALGLLALTYLGFWIGAGLVHG